MNLLRAPKFKIKGSVSHGFESVATAFENLYSRSVDKQSQLCVYHKGEKVVDLHGVSDSQTYDADTLACIFSSGKSIGSILIAMMVDQGRLNYEDRVSDHWPEFA